MLKAALPGLSTGHHSGGKPEAPGGLAERIGALACRRRYTVLVLLCLALYLPGIFTVPTIDRDEAYFAQASRQMLASGDFAIPHYLGRPHRKPPGIYWLQALSAKALGGGNRSSIWPYRVPSAAGATAAVVLTCWTGELLFDAGVGLLGGALLAASFLTVAQAGLARADAVLLACVAAAQACLAALYCGVADDTRRKLYSAGFWAAMAAGILIKGPVLPFVSAATIGGLFLLKRASRDSDGAHADLDLFIRNLCWPWAILLACAMVGGWLVAVIASVDWRLYLQSMSRDLFPKLKAGVESHWAPPGYYLLLAPVMFWPGSLFFGTAGAQGWRVGRASAGGRFCAAWLIPAWIGCELIPTKLPHYVLPAYPALAVLVAWAVGEWKNSPPRRLERLAAALWAAMTVGIGGAAIALFLVLGQPIGPAAIVLMMTVLATAFACAALAWKGRFESAAWLSIAGATIVFGWLRIDVLPNLDDLWLTRRVSAAVSRLGIESIGVLGYDEPSLIFALWPHVSVVNYAGAIDFLEVPGRRAILISSEYEAQFLAVSADRIQLHPVWSSRGFDYSKGHWMSVTLYQRQPVAAERQPASSSAAHVSSGASARGP